MAGASRLLTTTRAVSDCIPSTSCPSSRRLSPIKFPRSGGEKQGFAGCQARTRVAMSLDTAIVLPDKKQKPSCEEGMGIADISSLVAKLAHAVHRLINPLGQAVEMMHYWRTFAEMLIERGITGCRSFALIGVAGSLVGSILCFVEGCFLILESFFQYFQTVSSSMDQEGIMQSLVTAIDMFLVGTALLNFGMGLYIMFVRSDEMRLKRGQQIVESSCFGSFNIKKLVDSMEMKSISHAKSKLGNAILLILQAGLVEKFKNVQLASGLDVACFAGAIFFSSAFVFLLSKLTMLQRIKACL